MPHLPSEEEAETGITEKVAKNPSSQTESTASHHDMHDNEHGTAKAKAQDFTSKGPQIPTGRSISVVYSSGSTQAD